MASAGRAFDVSADDRPQRRITRRRLPLYSDPTFSSRLQHIQTSCQLLLNRRSTLIDIVRAVHASTDPGDVAREILVRLADWIPVTSWSVVYAHNGELTLLATNGDGVDERLIRRVASHVVEHTEWVVSNDLRADHRLGAEHALAGLAVPLVARHAVVGVLVGLDAGVSEKGAEVSSEFRRALDTLLESAGAALDNAMSLRRLEALSVTDDLTRLHNARYLNMALRRETRLANRKGHPVSLLFIDLDGFKSINDRHGHLAGSRALVETATVVRGCARETDIVARFGGDEFALILPDTGFPGALALGERVRERIAQHRFLAGDGLDIHLTASIGVATLPDAAATPDELVQAADAAMYRVKDSGKNGVQGANSVHWPAPPAEFKE